MLAGALENERGQFCQLVVEIVRAGVRYRQGKGPVTREEVERLNQLVAKVKFKIPELHDPMFLDALPRVEPQPKGGDSGSDKAVLDALQERLMAVTALPAQERGLNLKSS